MTIKMRLDTDSLRALIKDNPELEIEIGREVANNIKRDVVQLEVQKAVENCLKNMMEKSGSYYQPVYKAKDPKLVAAIAEVVTAITREQAEQLVAECVHRYVEKEIARQREELKAHLVVGLRDLLSPEMAKELVREKLAL